MVNQCPAEGNAEGSDTGSTPGSFNHGARKRFDHGDAAGTAKGGSFLTTTNTTGTTKNKICFSPCPPCRRG
jgi:hypothetical protein